MFRLLRRSGSVAERAGCQPIRSANPMRIPSGASDVAEPIHVFAPNHFIDELRAVLAEPGERVVEVVHGEHDPEVAEGVHGGVPVVGNRRRRESSIRP